MNAEWLLGESMVGSLQRFRSRVYGFAKRNRNAKKQEVKNMHDWRGNFYKREAIGKCDVKDCTETAMRQCCTAEGDSGRTHWHGRVHVRIDDGFDLMALCDKHYKEFEKKNNIVRH